MFRRNKPPNITHVHHQQPQIMPVVQTVHEHRAPTDASAKLILDLEKEAEKRIVNTYRIQNCAVDCVVIVETATHMDVRIWKARAKIAGYDVVAKVEVDFMSKPDVAVISKQLSHALAVEIARVIIHQPMLETMTQRNLQTQYDGS